MGLWAKLHTDIIGDEKLMRAARQGARHLIILPWLFAFAKKQDDGGRLSVNGEPAEPEDIARGIPNATKRSVSGCISELERLGILERDGDFLRFRQWEKRSGHEKRKPSDTPERVRERVARHREKTQLVDTPHSPNGVTPHVTPAVTPGVTRVKRPVDVDVDVERDKERRAESVTPRVTAPSHDEPGSAAAVALLPNCEEPKYPALALRVDESTGKVALEPPETPAQSPNGAVAGEARSQSQSPPASATPPATASPREVVLPHAAVRFGKTFYQRGTATDARRLDVFEQLLQVLKPEGLAFNGGVIRATSARLSAACLAVIRTHEKTPLEDTDAAIAYLLVKLSDVSQDSPTEKAAVDARVEEQRDRETFAERRERALRVGETMPEKVAELEAAAKKIFPGKDKEMAQPREAYVVSQLLKLEGVTA